MRYIALAPAAGPLPPAIAAAAAANLVGAVPPPTALTGPEEQALGSLGNRLGNQVSSFEDVRKVLAISADEDRREMAQPLAWSHMMKALSACGYEDGDFRVFARDLMRLDEQAFYHSVPPGITPRARAMLVRLLEALSSWGLRTKPPLAIEDAPAASSYQEDSQALAISSECPAPYSAPNVGHSVPNPPPMPGAAGASRRMPRGQGVPVAPRLPPLPQRRKIRGKQKSMSFARGHYDILGVRRSASSAEIRAAFRKKAIETHPDKSGNSDGEPFRKVVQAFETLSDDVLRAAYNMQLDNSSCIDGGGPNQVPTDTKEEEDASKSACREMREVHMMLIDMSQKAWGAKLATLDTVLLRDLHAWLQDNLLRGGARKARGLGDTRESSTTGGAPGFLRTIRPGQYRAEISWSGIRVLTSTTRSLAQAIDWSILLMNLRKTAQARQAASGGPCLSVEEVQEAIKLEPDVNIVFTSHLYTRNERIILPHTPNLIALLKLQASIQRMLQGDRINPKAIKAAIDKGKSALVRNREERTVRERRLANAVLKELKNRQPGYVPRPNPTGAAPPAQQPAQQAASSSSSVPVAAAPPAVPTAPASFAPAAPPVSVIPPYSPYPMYQPHPLSALRAKVSATVASEAGSGEDAEVSEHYSRAREEIETPATDVSIDAAPAASSGAAPVAVPIPVESPVAEAVVEERVPTTTTRKPRERFQPTEPLRRSGRLEAKRQRKQREESYRPGNRLRTPEDDE